MQGIVFSNTECLHLWGSHSEVTSLPHEFHSILASYWYSLVKVSEFVLLTTLHCTFMYAVAPPVPDCFAEGSSSTSIKLSWRRPPECRVDFFRLAWTTATTQPLPCPKFGEKRVEDVGSDVTEHILTELEIFHTYSITITAWNAIGNSTCSQDITTLPARM